MTGPQPPDPTTGGGALRAGELYGMVAAFLAAHRDTEYKVGEITAGTAASSSGAVFEACKRMAAAGYATHHTSPHRFQITPAGIAAAGTLPPPGPRTPRTRGPRTATTRGPIRRPNGDLYYPRRLAGRLDVDVLRDLRSQGVPVLLYGPPGTGKTALVEAAFGQIITLAGTGDTCVEDFTGSYAAEPGGGYTFSYGGLVTAMRDGLPYLIDDATLVPPKVLAVTYPAMDGRRRITIPGYRNETVDAADGFYVIACHNPGVHGAVLTEALSSRFAVHIEVTTDMDVARRAGVPPPAIAAAVALNQLLAAGAIGWAPQLRELLAFTKISRSLGVRAAVNNLAAIAPADDRDDVITELRKHFGPDVTPLTLDRRR
jgi:nitric oxide reductase NorQ protein